LDLVTYWKSAIAPWLRAKAHVENERGAALVEYALLVALIAVVCIVAITFIGTKARGTFDSVGSKLPG
jgi:pilus assembly protein Flp/PilA